MLLWRSPPRRPLTDLHDDVLRCVLDYFAAHDLATLARTCSALRPLATRALYNHITLSSVNALDLLVRSLEACPTLGQHVISFAEDVDRPFLFLETHPPYLLARALRHTSRLQSLKLRSPIELALGPELQSLCCLRALELRDATPETVRAVLPHVPAVEDLVLLRASAGWSEDDDCSGAAPADVGYLLRCTPTLRALEVDADLLRAILARLSEREPDVRRSWQRVRSLTTHGRVPDSALSLPLTSFFPALDVPPRSCSDAACCASASYVFRRPLECGRSERQRGFLVLWRTAAAWIVFGSLCSVALVTVR